MIFKDFLLTGNKKVNSHLKIKIQKASLKALNLLNAYLPTCTVNHAHKLHYLSKSISSHSKTLRRKLSFSPFISLLPWGNTWHLRDAQL